MKVRVFGTRTDTQLLNTLHRGGDWKAFPLTEAPRQCGHDEDVALLIFTIEELPIIQKTYAALQRRQRRGQLTIVHLLQTSNPLVADEKFDHLRGIPLPHLKRGYQHVSAPPKESELLDLAIHEPLRLQPEGPLAGTSFIPRIDVPHYASI